MTTKQEMTQDVKSHNINMSIDHISNMPVMELLRNTHPLYRGEYAYKLKLEGTISEDEASEFVRRH